MKHLLLSLVAIATLCLPATAQQKVKNVYAYLTPLNIEQMQNSDQAVQLNRYVFAGYNSICLPMAVSNEQLQAQVEGIRLETLVGIAEEGNTLNLYFIDCTEKGIEAGRPYLIFSPRAANLRLPAEGVSERLETVRLTSQQGNTVTFAGNWDLVRQEGLYGIPAKQDAAMLESILVRTDGEKAFPPTRCGFSWEEQSATTTTLCIRHIKSLDETTGIQALTNGQQPDAIYDLSGRKTTDAKKGIVIQNGKKRVVK